MVIILTRHAFRAVLQACVERVKRVIKISPATGTSSQYKRYEPGEILVYSKLCAPFCHLTWLKIILMVGLQKRPEKASNLERLLVVDLEIDGHVI